MVIAPHPKDEPARLDDLRRYHLLDTRPEADYDDLTRLASIICGTPIALVSLVDADRQWFKSRVGLEATETPRGVSFCAHAILQNDLFVVEDAAADERFADNPLVTSAPHVRFYAGVPLATPAGHNAGTLCVIDRVPRTLTAEQKDALRVLGRQVVAQMRLRETITRLDHQVRDHETFRVLFEHSSDAHLIFDERDGIIDCNRAAVAMLGCRDKSEVLSLHPAVLSPEFQPDGRRSLEKCVEMDATARRNGYHRFDWVHRRADGVEFPCEVTLTPVTLHGRAVLLVVWHELSERKQAETALRASEAKFRDLFEHSTDLIQFVAPDGSLQFVNSAWRQALGYTEDEVRRLSLFEVIHPDYQQHCTDLFRRVLAGEDVGRVESRFVTKGGATLWVEGAVNCRIENGQPVTTRAIFRDVTARKAAEEEVRATSDRRREQQAALLELIRTDLLEGERVTWGVLEVIARTVGVDRVSVWHLDPTHQELRCQAMYELWSDWFSAGMTLSAADYPTYFRALETEEVIAADTADDDPRTREFRDSYLRPLGISSMLDVPLRLGGVLSGVLCLEHIGPPRVWESDEQVFALAAATVLSLAAEQSERMRTEHALRESEERFRAAMTGSLDAVFFLEAERADDGSILDFRFADLNPRAEHLISRPRAEVIGARLCELLPVNRTGGFLDKYVRVMETGETLEEEFPIAAEGVVASWLHHQVVRVGDGVAITSQNITARKQAEDALRASEERQKLALEGGGLGAWDWHIPSGHVEFNDRWAEMIGYRLDEIKPTVKAWENLVHPDDLPAVLADLEEHLAGRTPSYSTVHRIRHKAGHWIWVLDRGRVIDRDADGRPLRACGTHLDVTDQKAAEQSLRESEEKFRTVVDELAEGVVLLDYDTRRVLRSNRAMLDMVGYTAEEFAALTKYDFVSEPREVIDRHLTDIATRGQGELTFRKYRRKDGSLVDVQVNGSRMTLNGRTVICLAVRDMTTIYQAEAAVRESEDYLRDILEHMDEMVHRFDEHLNILYTNRAWQKKFGYTEDEAKTLSLLELVHPDDRHIAMANVGKLFAGERVRVEARMRTKSRETVHVAGTSGARFEGDRAVYFRTIIRDVTEQRANEERVRQYQAELERANAKLQTLATTDALTGVKNRGAFNERLAEEFDRAVRYDRPLSVVLVDVDHFKAFNDTFGHPAGDAVLKRVAATLHATVRSTDTVARYGGEEFVILLQDTDQAGAIVLAERCRRAVAEVDWEQRAITISVGVSTRTTATADGHALVKEADDALYQSKRGGRNRVNHSSHPVSVAATVRTPS